MPLVKSSPDTSTSSCHCAPIKTVLDAPLTNTLLTAHKISGYCANLGERNEELACNLTHCCRCHCNKVDFVAKPSVSPLPCMENNSGWRVYCSNVSAKHSHQLQPEFKQLGVGGLECACYDVVLCVVICLSSVFICSFYLWTCLCTSDCCLRRLVRATPIGMRGWERGRERPTSD